MGVGGSKESKYLQTILSTANCANFNDNGASGGNEGGNPDGNGDYLGIDSDGSKASASVKDSVIREIAYGFAEILHTKKPAANASPKELVKWMRESLPNPNDGRSITADSGKQTQLCKSLGGFLLKVYPESNIDMSLSGGGICSQVAEVVGTMGSGVYSEFIESATGVQRTIDNIKVVGEFIRRAKSRIMKIAEGADRSVAAELGSVMRICDEIMKEHDRQLVILSQLTDTVVKPVTRDLVSLLKENADFAGLVNSLQAAMGTSEWGDRISYAMAGVPNLGDMMLKTKDAAQKLNMSVRDVLNAPSLKQLKLDIEKVKRGMSSDTSRKAIEEMSDAEGALTKAYRFRSKLKEKTDGGAQVSGGLPTVERRLKTQTLTRKTMLRSFTEKSHILFERMLHAVYGMSKKLGSQIPLTDDLSRFVHTFDQMGNIYKEGIEYALTGYYQHASATEQRERFIGQMNAVLASLTSLSAGTGGEYFRDIKAPLEELQKHIDFYIDRFNIHESPNIQRTYKGAMEGGVIEGTPPAPSLRTLARQAAGQALTDPAGAIRKLRETGESVKAEVQVTQASAARGLETGGDLEGAVGGGQMSKAALTLQNTARTLKHFFAVAKMRANLHKVSTESKKYNEKYETVLGDSLSKCIDAVKRDYNTFKSIIDDERSDTYYTYMKIGKVYGTISSATGGGTAAMREWDKSVILKVKKNMVAAKIELYRALQAIDLYLMHFSDSVAANPDDIKEVTKLLDSIEIVSEWFNERSGDSIAGLFEYMPFMARRFEMVNSPLMDGKDSIIDEKTSRMKTVNTHYYKNVGDAMLRSQTIYNGTGKFNKDTTSSNPGNPFLAISPQRTLYAQEFAKKTTERVLALKNIVAAFTYLGNKFGGETVTSKVFMSPAQIYKALVSYLHVSAFTMGWDGYNDETNSDTPNAHNAFALPYRNTENADVRLAGGGAGRINGAINTWNSSIGTGGHVNVGAPAPTGADHLVLMGVNSFVSNDFSAMASVAPGVVNDDWTDTAYVPGTPIPARAPHASWRESLTDAPFLKPNGAGGDRRWPYLLHTRVEADTNMPDAPPFAKCAFGCAMNSVKFENNRGTNTVGGWHDEFAETDELFIISIKAMVAKVFTCSGLYNMFNYKSRDDHTMSSTRFVIGGNADGGIDTPSSTLRPSNIPEIHEDAVELYIRLPLLVEFYRDVFSLDKDPTYTTDNLVVALVPEMDPMWTGIMRYAFEMPMGSGGVITKNYASRMISEVNGIYTKYRNKGSTNLVSAVVTDFIADVNSRFGIMKRNEVQQYKNTEKQKRRELYMNNDAELRDFDTLEEGEETGHAGVAPSDKFGTVPYGESLDTHEYKSSFISAIADFRGSIDKKIRDAVYRDNDEQKLGRRIHGLPNFHDQVRITKDSLKSATTPEQRFGNIYATMSGMDSAVKRAEEAYIMFHETVVAPLAVLSSICEQMRIFEKTVWYNCIGSFFKVLDVGLKPNGALRDLWYRDWNTATAANVTTLYNMAGIVQPLQDLLPEDLKSDVTNILASVRRPDSYSFRVGMEGLNVQKDSWPLLATHIRPGSHPSASDDMAHRSVIMIAMWQEKCFKHLTQLLLSHSSALGGLVDINTSGKKLVVDHSKLQSYCEDTLTFVRKSIHKFRGVINATTINSYDGGNRNGSIAWVQSNLIDNMFNGNNSGGLPKALTELSASYMVFNNLNPNVSGQQCFNRNLRLMQWPNGAGVIVDVAPTVGAAVVSGINFTAAAADPNTGQGQTDADYPGWSFDSVLSELVYYNPLTVSDKEERNGTHPYDDPANASLTISGNGTSFMNPNVPGNIKNQLTRNDVLQHLLKSPPDSGKGARVYQNAWFMGRWDIYLGDKDVDGWRGDRPARRSMGFSSQSLVTNQPSTNASVLSDGGEGLMMRFNEVLSTYLEQFWDQSSSKIYQPVIADFANGAANQAVMRAQGWPDLFIPSITPVVDKNLQQAGLTMSGGTVLNADALPFAGTDENSIEFSRTSGNFLNFTEIENPSSGNWQSPIPQGGRAAEQYVPNPNWFSENDKWASRFGALIKTFTPGAGYNGEATSSFGSLYNKYAFDNIVTKITDINAGITLGNTLTFQISEVPTRPWIAACANMQAGRLAIDAIAATIVGNNVRVPMNTFNAAKASFRELFPIASPDTLAAAAQTVNPVTQLDINAAKEMKTTIAGNLTLNAVMLAGSDVLVDPANSIQQYGLGLSTTAVNPYLSFRGMAGTVDDGNQIQYYFGGTPATRTVGGQSLDGGFMKAWCLRACVRARNEFIKEFNNSPGFTNELMTATTHAVSNRVSHAEKQWHLERVENLIALRHYAGGLQAGSSGTIDNLTAGRTVWDVPGPHVALGTSVDDNRNAIDSLVNEIMDIINPLLEAYRLIIETEGITSGPAGAVAATILALPISGVDITNTIFSGGSKACPFDSVSRIMQIAGTDNGRVNNFPFVQALIYLGLKPWQIKDITADRNNTNAAQRLRNLLIPTNGTDTRIISVANHIGSSIRLASFYGLGINSKRNAGRAVANNTTAFTANNRDVFQLAGTNELLPSAPKAGCELFNGGTARQLTGLGGHAYQASVTAANIASVDAGLGKLMDNVNLIFAPFRRQLGQNDTTITTEIENATQAADAVKILGVLDEGRFGNPREIVFASLSKIMRTMLTEQARPGTPSFLITNLSEVPLRMKESFKANLPGFVKMFGMIHSSANVLKKIMRMGLNVRRVNINAAAPGAFAKASVYSVYGPVDGYLRTVDNADITQQPAAQNFYNRLLDKITTSCESVIKCATKVLDEIGDNPLYLETHENSISDYRNSTNITPFMPPSTALLGLQYLDVNGDNIKREPTSLLPLHPPGSKQFEFNYGTRLVLNRPVVQALLDHFPGMREITEQYNKVALTEKQIALESVNTFLGKYIALLRWTSDVRVYAPFANGFVPACEQPLFANDANDLNSPINYSNRPLIATLNIDSAIELTSSSDKHGSHVKMTNHIGGDDAAGQRPISRSDVQVYNIIDLNINPININALRREVPLINTLNYAYTFDSFARDIIGNFNIPNTNVMQTNDNSLQTLLTFVLHPHIRANFADSAATGVGGVGPNMQAQLSRAFGTGPGMNSILGGHDRFVNEQIMNKALFANGFGNLNSLQSPYRNANSNRRAVNQVPDAKLYYFDPAPTNGQRRLDSADVTQGGGEYLRVLGGMRFDTTYIRNLLFISCAHRLMRAKMADEMTKNSYPVVSGPAATRKTITDALPWETWEELRTD